MQIEISGDVTIGIAAHNGAAVTKLALDCLFHAVRDSQYELILVNDASTDDTAKLFAWAASIHKPTRIFEFKQNLDYVHSVNAILSHAQGQRIVFLSNDYLVSPAWLRKTLASLDQDPSNGIVTGVSNFCDNMNSPTRNLLNPRFGINGANELYAFAHGVASAFETRPLIHDPYFVGDAFVVTREVLKRVGTFDTRFVGYVADLDFSIRCRKSGLAVVTNQSAFAYHMHGANFSNVNDEARESRIQARLARVFRAFNQFIHKYQLGDVVSERQEHGPIPESDLIAAATHAQQRIREDQVFVAPISYEPFETRSP